MSFSPYGTDKTDSLFLNLGILKLNQLNKLEKAKFIFKHQNNKLPPSFDDYFRNVNEVHGQHPRRDSARNIYPAFGRTGFASNLIQNEGASIWNNIPISIRNVESVKTFATNYKKHLLYSA